MELLLGKVICPQHISFFSFRTITNGFSPNLICALILWRSGLGLLIGKFGQFLTELSAHNMIMAGYFRFSFLFLLVFRENKNVICYALLARQM